MRVRHDGHPRDLRALGELAGEGEEAEDTPVVFRDDPLLRLEVAPCFRDPLLNAEPVRQPTHDRLAGVLVISLKWSNAHDWGNS
jgi:hypothetical protein